jgi:hypothetical protein
MRSFVMRSTAMSTTAPIVQLTGGAAASQTPVHPALAGVPVAVEPDAASAEIPRREPRGGDWEIGLVLVGATQWINQAKRLVVLSSVQLGAEPAPGPCWHVSVVSTTRAGFACVAPDAAVDLVRRDFDLLGAEEDNHVPHGKARNLWLPVRHEHQGVECSCKEDETPHRDGAYVWRDVPEK